MKKIIILGLTILTMACASKKEKADVNFSAVELQSACPEDGKCNIKLIENKLLELKTDEFGKLFYTLKNDDTKNVIVYQYERNVPEGVQDASYREEIMIEIDKKTSLPTCSKTTFGRFCFCKGFTGYYKIYEEVVCKNLNDKIIYELQFKVNEVPQVITNLKFILH